MDQKIQRLYSVDVFRILCAFIVFCFHAHVSVDIYTNFGFLNSFFSYGHIFMMAFFMLSGFSLYYSDYERHLIKDSDDNYGYLSFLLKRLSGIYPLYLFSATFYIVFYNNLTLLQNIMLIPLEISLMQSVYPNSFYVSHFSGTWFISCIVICYLLFPFVKKRVLQNSIRINFLVLLVIWFFCSYQFILVHFFNFADNFVAVYNNPIVRFIEFLSGLIVADLFEKNKSKSLSKKLWWMTPVVFFFFVSFIVVTERFRSMSLYFYYFFSFPTFTLLLYLLGRLESLYPITFGKKIISVLSENTYAFFLAQFFTWPMCKYINNHVFHLCNNSLFLFCFAWCSVFTVFMHYVIEKPCKRFFLMIIKNRLA